jgi:BatD DUF11 like domain
VADGDLAVHASARIDGLIVISSQLCMALLLGCLLTVLSGHPALAQQLSSAPTPPVEQHKSLGAVRLRLATDRQSIGVADTLRLTLLVEAPSEARLTLPDVSKTLGPFEVVQQRTTGPLSLTPQTQQWQREYVLAVASAGSLTVPKLTVHVQEGDTVQPLSTDPFTITVTTLVSADADPSSLKDIAPPVALVRRGLPPWVWSVAGGLGGIGLLTGGWWWYRHQRRPTSVPVVQRSALALAALEQLQQQDLIGQQRIEEFYVRLSDILRRYIELRFGLRAPEQTTEEFLAAVLAMGGLIAIHRDLLDAFLQHCDLVKFARHRPAPGAMEEAFESAKNFVEYTADMHIVVVVPRSGEPAL